MNMKGNAAPSAPESRLAPLILTCFFLSGMTALIYEIIWMRMISRVIGGAPFAVSTILVVFMGGMGVGSYIASRKADQMEEIRLVRIYGLLELAIGIYALCVPILLMLLKGVYGFLYNALFAHTLLYNLFIFAGAVVLLALPAVCMGATLPVLCRFYVSRLSHVGTHAGRLYGLNTIGAAAGSLLCGFWLINALGVWGTLLAAVAVNCTIGAICLRIKPSSQDKGQKKTPAAEDRKRPALPPAPETGCTNTAALIIFLVSGFCAMAYEVLWTKLLGLLIGPTTYSFTIVLVTFIVGLALGNLVFGRWADRTRNALGLLVATQIAAALTALLISQIFGNSQLFFAKLLYTFKDHFGVLSLVKALVVFAFMLLPTFLLGATFPLVAKIYTRSVAEVGRRIGIAYVFNTAGAVLGSFCAGFVLIPLVGKENGLRLVIALQMATSLIVAAWLLLPRKAPVLRWAALTAALSAGVLLCTLYPAWNRHLLATGKYHRFDETTVVDEMIQNTGWFEALVNGPQILSASERGELVYYGDGIGGFTTVLRYPGPFGEAQFSMANSGKMDASSRDDMKTQTLLAHFPLLFAKAPQNVMVLGLASGVTAGEVLHYPIARLDVVDINERVFEAARWFGPWNNDVLNHPKTRPIVQDGLAHLSLTRTRYDVIISEPSNPWMAGMAALFTREFFESVKSKLTGQGIYVQWFHCYQMDWETFALIGRTFAEAFNSSILVSCEPGGLSADFLFVGFKNRSGLNWDTARLNIEYARRSKNIALAYPELLYRMIVCEDLKALFGTGAVHTEDRPLLESAAPKLMYQGEAAKQTLLQHLVTRAWLSSATRQAARRLQQSVAAQIDFAAYALSVHSPFMNMVDFSAADAGQKEKYAGLLENYCVRNPLDLSFVRDDALIDRLRDVQIAGIEEKLPAISPNAAAHLYLARLFSDKGMIDQAIANYREAVRLQPDNAEAHNDLGCMLSDKGAVEEAIQHYKEALRVRPNMVLALGNMAFIHLRRNKPDDALFYFQETLRVRPGIAESHYYIGQIYYKQKQTAKAADHFRQAVQLNPNMAEAHNNLAWILATAEGSKSKDPAHAVAFAQKACALTGERNALFLSTLAVAYSAAGQIEASRQTAARALEIARAEGREDIVTMLEENIRK